LIFSPTLFSSARESGTKAGLPGTGTALGSGLASTSGTGSLRRESGLRDTGTYEQGPAIPVSTFGTGGDTGITETRRDAGELGTGRVSSEFYRPVSAILDSDVPVAALEGGHTFGHTSMESMPDSKALEETDRLKRELAWICGLNFDLFLQP
jgi:hypothetical protein